MRQRFPVGWGHPKARLVRLLGIFEVPQVVLQQLPEPELNLVRRRVTSCRPLVCIQRRIVVPLVNLEKARVVQVELEAVRGQCRRPGKEVACTPLVDGLACVGLFPI